MKKLLSGVLALSVAILSGCSAYENTEPYVDYPGLGEPSPTPDSSPTPEPTPWPLTLDAGDYELWNAYAFPQSDGYVLEPTGSATVADGVLMGELLWLIYQGLDEYAEAQVLCAYVQAYRGEPDIRVEVNPDCVGCEAYYLMAFEPATESTIGADYAECDEVALELLLDSNGDGVISDDELETFDWWGLSDISEGDYPEKWAESDLWLTDNEPFLTENEAHYAVWSFRWATSETDYLPIFALY